LPLKPEDPSPDSHQEARWQKACCQGESRKKSPGEEIRKIRQSAQEARRSGEEAGGCREETRGCREETGRFRKKAGAPKRSAEAHPGVPG
jgi:hypothetical protein